MRNKLYLARGLRSTEKKDSSIKGIPEVVDEYSGWKIVLAKYEGEAAEKTLAHLNSNTREGKWRALDGIKELRAGEELGIAKRLEIFGEIFEIIR